MTGDSSRSRWRRRVGAVAAALTCAAIVATFAVCALPRQGIPAQSPATHEAKPSPGWQEPMTPASTQQADADAPVAFTSSNARYVDDSLVVTFESDAALEDVAASLSRASAVCAPSITQDDIRKGFATLAVSPGSSVEAAVREVSELAGIRSSQPNYVYHLLDEGDNAPAASASLRSGIVSALAASIDDAKSAQLWHLDAEHGVSALDAWELSRAESSERPVTVAVIDSGCDISHEDLAANVYRDEGQVVCYDASATGEYAGSGTGDISTNGHGTHVCGTVSAVANNGIGVAGVSYNAKFIPIQVFQWAKVGTKRTMTATTDALLEAYTFICDNAEKYSIRVANMSLGAKIDADEAIMAKIGQAHEAGVLNVCAAGNSDLSQSPQLTVPYTIFPGDYLAGRGFNVIALDKQRNRPSYSNYNVAQSQTKDICAPGGVSTSGNGIFSTLKNGRYGELHGTSMATPIVSGVSALLFAASPDLTPAQAIDIVHSTATDLGAKGFDADYGYGLVNAHEAVKCAKATLVLGTRALSVGEETSVSVSAQVAGSWALTSSNPSVAVVEGGHVRAVSPGHATITAARGSFSISEEVTVEKVAEEIASPDTGNSSSPDTGNSSSTNSGKHDDVVSSDSTSTEIKNETPVNTKSDVKHDASETKTATGKQAGTSNSSARAGNARADVSTATIELADAFEYTGRPILPVPVVKVGGKVLPSRFYSLKYSNTSKVGTAYVIAQGRGAYRDLRIGKSYRIVKARQSIRVAIKARSVSARLLKKKARTLKCVQGTAGCKTKLRYGKVRGSGRLSVNASNGSVKVKKKTRKGTYKLVMSAYATESANYEQSNTVRKALKIKVKR